MRMRRRAEPRGVPAHARSPTKHQRSEARSPLDIWTSQKQRIRTAGHQAASLLMAGGKGDADEILDYQEVVHVFVRAKVAAIEFAHRIRKNQLSIGRGRRHHGRSRKAEWAMALA